MFSGTRYWWVFAVTGVIWLLVAVIIFRFDYLTIGAISVLFGCIAIAAGLNELLIAALTPSTGWAIVRGILGAVFITTGVIAFINPGGTFVALAAVISFFFIFKGAFDVADAISSARVMPTWWLLLVLGLAELLLGLWAAGNWRLSAILLVAWAGTAALIRGVTELILAFRLREAEAIVIVAAPL